ncbi:MAG: DHH family phosphoesterase, partial [Candidatus Pacearchaeota archaeon]|nr:DHH family phosphoesterase [Candidatus Pacearchaeota archaeon]
MRNVCLVLLIVLFISGCVSAPEDGKTQKLLYKLEEELTSPAVTVPVVTEEVLENGLRLVLMPRKDLPVIHALLSFVHGGSAFDTEELAGLASLTSSLLKKGTETKTASEISEILDFVGADISAACSKDSASISLDILSEYSDLGLDLFSEIITHPLFEEQEITRLKQQVLSSILGNKDQSDIYATQMFSEYVYKKHPYHRPVQGYEKTIPAISRKNIVGFHKTHYIPNDAILVIVGDFDVDGATSTTVAVKAMRSMGAKNIEFLVPNRFEYGYGLTPEIVQVAVERFKPDVIITVDNGISSLEGVKVAKALNIKVIVTDHHLPGEILPAADAIVNPNQPGDEFPSKMLAGVGVIFYVMLAVRSFLREQGWFDEQDIKEPNLAELLDLVALGTVADVVPLDYNNRILVSQGLARIRS